MIQTGLGLLLIAAGGFAVISLACTLLFIARLIVAIVRDRRRPVLTDQQIADAGRPFVDPVYVWPTIAPQNGHVPDPTSHEDLAG